MRRAPINFARPAFDDRGDQAGGADFDAVILRKAAPTRMNAPGA